MSWHLSKRWMIAVAAGVFAAGCGPVEVGAGAQAQASSPAGLAALRDGPRGYVHAARCSRFLLGPGAQSKRELGLDKLVGPEGVFATNPVTGASRAILNATSPALRKGPFTADKAAYEAHVMAYFQACGLPQDQIGLVRTLTMMEADGDASQTVRDVKPKLAGYTTVITRAIDGIPVPDSFAAARIDEDDEVVMEWVYWPSLPQRAVDEAQRLRASVADEAGRRAMADRLPAELRASPSEVTIRHSDFDDESGFRAFGSLDVHAGKETRGGLRGGTLHFDASGRELIHPNRRAEAHAALRDTPRP